MKEFIVTCERYIAIIMRFIEKNPFLFLLQLFCVCLNSIFTSFIIAESIGDKSQGFFVKLGTSINPYQFCLYIAFGLAICIYLVMITSILVSIRNHDKIVNVWLVGQVRDGERDALRVAIGIVSINLFASVSKSVATNSFSLAIIAMCMLSFFFEYLIYVNCKNIVKNKIDEATQNIAEEMEIEHSNARENESKPQSNKGNLAPRSQSINTTIKPF